MALTTTHDDPVSEEIVSDAFFGGNVEAGDWQEEYRIPVGTTAPETFVAQLRLAVDEINADLAEWRAARELEGQTVLTDEQRRFYLAAVYARAYALLIPLLPQHYATDQGDGLEDDLDGNEGRFAARSEHFVKLIVGRAEPGDFAMSVI